MIIFYFLFAPDGSAYASVGPGTALAHPVPIHTAPSSSSLHLLKFPSRRRLREYRYIKNQCFANQMHITTSTRTLFGARPGTRREEQAVTSKINNIYPERRGENAGRDEILVSY